MLSIIDIIHDNVLVGKFGHFGRTIVILDANFTSLLAHGTDPAAKPTLFALNLSVLSIPTNLTTENFKIAFALLPFFLQGQN